MSRDLQSVPRWSKKLYESGHVMGDKEIFDS